ncbi:SLC13 family permease [Candidatus Latescibacterota bacterium]
MKVDLSRGAAIAALLCLAVGLVAPFSGVPAAGQRALGIALFAIICWTAQPVPLELSSLVALLLLPAAGLLTLRQSLDAFAGPTVWLVFAGMVLSHAVSRAQLGRAAVARLMRHLTGGRFRLLASLHLLGLASSLIIPSAVVRVLLLLPLGEAVIERLVGGRDPTTRTAVLLSLVCSTYYGGCGVLTGTVPNLVVVGQLEAVSGEVMYWSEWLVWMFPIIGLARTGLSLAVIWALYGRHLPPQGPTMSPPRAEPLGGDQTRVLVILGLGVALWSTDAAHHLAPVYVGLLLVVLCILPRWGPLSLAQLRQVNFPFFFYLAALFAIGDALEAAGVSQKVLSTAWSWATGTAWFSAGEGSWLARHLAVTALVVPLDFLMDIAAAAAVATPTMLELAGSQGMSPMGTAMCVAMATTLVFLPYQSAPFMVALREGQLRLGQLVICMLIISALSLIVLCPLNIVFWRYLGLI